jgi:hypothetical protein
MVNKTTITETKGTPTGILSVASAGLAFFHLLTPALFRVCCGSFTLKLLKSYVLLVHLGKILMSAHQTGSNNPIGLNRTIDKIPSTKTFSQDSWSPSRDLPTQPRRSMLVIT